MSTVGEFEERRFTRAELNRMIEDGYFADDTRRFELIHGRLILVPPEGPLHASIATDFQFRMNAAYGGRAHVRDAKPLDCGPEEQPEPDLAVVLGEPRAFAERHPRGDETLLVIEVRRSTLARDHEKAGIYAAANVPEYWLVDVEKRRVELHREPRGDRYGLVRLIGVDEELELPSATIRIPVADLVGPPR